MTDSKARKITNIALTTLVALFLCATAASLVAVEAGVKFPEFIGIGKSKSQMEGRKYASTPDTSLKSIANGSFQSDAESYLSDHFPMRDDVLLANAAMQRSCIAAANLPLGYDCYPTYFNSDYMCLAKESAVNFIPETWNEETEKLTREFAQGVAKTARQYPEKRFVIYVVPGAESASKSPAYELMSSPFEPSLSVDVMKQELASLPNVWVMTSEYENLDAFYQDFFKSDHHWNALGALKAYGNIGEVLEWDALDYASLKDFGSYRFFGSTARSGLCPVLEPVFDIDYSFSNIEIKTSKGVKNADDHDAFYNYTPKSAKKFAFHTYYYNTQPPSGVFSGGSGSRNALLVSNSYGAVLSRPLALNYSKLYRTNDLHRDAKNQHLSADLEKSDIDDVIFVAQPVAFKTAMEQSPDYFD